MLDSEILAEVYLELIGGRQPDFALNIVNNTNGPAIKADYTPPKRPNPLPPRLTAEESDAHEVFVKSLGDQALWRQA